MSLIFKAAIVTSGEYYSSIQISDIKNNDGSKVTVTKFLELFFHSPVDVLTKDIQFDKWDEPYPADVTSTKIDDALYDIAVKFSSEDHAAFTIDPGNDIVIGLNSPTGDPDLSVVLESFLDTIELTTDTEPDIYGEVEISSADSPIAVLQGIPFTVNLSRLMTRFSYDIKPGETITEQLEVGEYSVSADNLASADGNTVVKTLIDSDSTIEVAIGETTSVAISFGNVLKYSSVDFSINDISVLSDELLTVSLSVGDSYNNSFRLRPGEKIHLSNLPETGQLSVNVTAFTLNNKRYTFSFPKYSLYNNTLSILLDESNITVDEISSDDFIQVSVNLQTNVELGKSIPLRLVDNDMAYAQDFLVKGGTQSFSIKLKPGVYRVEIDNFIVDKTVYVVNAASEFTVSATSNVLPIIIKKSASLVVKGFDSDYLTFGGCTNLATDNEKHLTESKASSIFKYAGSGGDGDPNHFLEVDNATEHTIELARKIETNLGKPVLPVMISYTVQLSGGDAAELSNIKHLTHSFANFILTLQTAQKYKDADHPVPIGVIVNPDMLGACQQHGLTPDQAVPTIKALQDALAHWNIKQDPPAEVTDDIKGYIQGVNWLVRTLAPEITFGWQINLWGTGGSQWVYDNASDTQAINAARETANYVASLGVYAGNYIPDFLAIDRYEADDLTSRSYVNSYCYGPSEWKAYFVFCAEISMQLALPIIPWQLPSSRTPLVDDLVDSSFDSQHWGSAANYILGDPELGSDVKNIHPTIREFKFKDHGAGMLVALVGETPADMYQKNGGFDVSLPAYTDFPKYGIMHVMFGGGSTLGMVPPVDNASVDMSWLANKFSAYDASPVTFADSVKKA